MASEEIFEPVLSVMTFRTPEEAFERANNIPYGLSAGVWTDKGSKIFKMVNKLRAGVVWANTYNKFDPTSPFGGYKESVWWFRFVCSSLASHVPRQPCFPGE